MPLLTPFVPSSSPASLLVNLSVLLTKPTGISTYSLNILPYLKELDPTLLTPYPLDPFNCHLISSRLSPEHGLSGHFLRLNWTQWILPHLYTSWQSRGLFSPLPEAPLYTSCSYVVMLHDLIPLRIATSRALTAYFRYYVPQVLKQARHVICNSQATADDAMTFYGIPASHITPIPLACQREAFPYLDLPVKPYFLYLGRQAQHKNLARLIQAFSLVSRTVISKGHSGLSNHSEYQLWIAGETKASLHTSLRRQIQELNLDNQVVFLGYLTHEDLLVALNQATALVMPSLWEGFGLPILEAMSCGTPVITSTGSSLPEVAGDAALLVDPYSPEQIARAMREMIEVSGLRETLREKGFAQVQQFSWQKTGLSTCQLLQQYLG
jgi:glycosyltransferase involved in cell wall biosynthesis